LVRLIKVFDGELTRQEIQDKIGLKDRKNFRDKFLSPAIKIKIIVPVGKYNPKDRTQKYRLTAKGNALQKQLKK